MSANELTAWLYGTHIATLRPVASRAPSGRLRWTWTSAAAARWGLRSRVVSHLLPVDRGGRSPSDVIAGAFCQGLLPEGATRIHHAVAAGVEPDDTFGFLARYGQDTAGALLFVRAEQPPSGPFAMNDHTGYRPLTSKQVADRLREASEGTGVRALQSISLAGMIPKVGLGRGPDGTWLEPHSGAPSTWILKVAHGTSAPASDVVDTEVLCLRLAARVGITNVTAEIVNFENVKAIGVSRYDRFLGPDGGVGRVHQEDLAQALGLNTADPIRKFQRGSTMPSWAAAAAVLRDGGGKVAPLARLVCFSFVVGNTDHHAKNTSFLRHDDGSVSLAPAYDIAAHLHHSGRHMSALDLGGKRDFDELTIDDVVAEIASWGVLAARARAVCRDVVSGLQDSLRREDRASYPGVADEVWTTLQRRTEIAGQALAE